MSGFVAEARTHAVNCPSCGGVVENVDGRGYHQCSYCQSLVFSNENPLSVDRITTLGKEMPAPCPCCQLPLQQGELDNRPVLYCGNCYGVMIRTEHFGAALRERRSRRSSADAEDPKPIDLKQYERILKCPNCSRNMDVHPYYGPGNVVIDSCGHCSLIWLDHGELTRLERASGGREPATIFHGYGDSVTAIPSSGSYDEPEVSTVSALHVIANLFLR
ncbi:MAG: zf-TFIIB domain-containing protein [Planctomyces sp.]|nr:zf-TFIIB domain-containing protein [Planctomyces sp.]